MNIVLNRSKAVPMPKRASSKWHCDGRSTQLPPLVHDTSLTMMASKQHQRWKILRGYDVLSLRLQEVVPYQGLALPKEITQALKLLPSASFVDGIPCFPPIFRGQKRRELLDALGVIHGLDLPSLDGRRAALSFQLLSPYIPTLISFSIPSLLPTLQECVESMAKDNIAAFQALKWYGDCAHYFKDYTRAHYAYTQLLAEGKDMNDISLIAHAHRGLGDCAIKCRRYREALRRYQSAIRLYERIGKKESLPRSYRSLADAQRSLGNFDSAIETYTQAGTLAQEHGQRWNYSKTLQERGWTEWKHGNLEDAIASFSAALNVHKELDRSRGRFTCYFALARLLTFKRLNKVTLHPSPEESKVACLLGHRPWKERAALLGLPW